MKSSLLNIRAGRFFLPVMLFFVACSPIVRTSITQSYEPQPYNKHVRVYELEEPIPAQAKILGDLKVGDSGFTIDCGYQKVLEDAKEATRQAGGNALKITAHKLPTVFGSSCHRISAKILRLGEVEMDSVETSFAEEPFQNKVENPVVDDEYSKLRFSLNVGPGYRTGKIPGSLNQEMEDYIRKLKWGTHVDADICYFFSETVGLGLKYNQFDAKNSLSNYSADIDQDGIIDHGRIKDDMRISFIGPLFQSRVLSMNQKNAFYSNIALGYLSYRNNSAIVGYNIDYKGGAFGYIGALGYQFGVSDNVSISLELSYLIGTLSKVQIDYGSGYSSYDLDDDQRENLSRFNLSIGLVFHD